MCVLSKHFTGLKDYLQQMEIDQSTLLRLLQNYFIIQNDPNTPKVKKIIMV